MHGAGRLVGIPTFIGITLWVVWVVGKWPRIENNNDDLPNLKMLIVHKLQRDITRGIKKIRRLLGIDGGMTRSHVLAGGFCLHGYVAALSCLLHHLHGRIGGDWDWVMAPFWGGIFLWHFWWDI